MSYLEEAVEILDNVKGKPLSLSERKRLSVELAALMLHESEKTMTSQEKKVHQKLTRLIHDPIGKAFTTALTDECFRSQSNKRIANQMIYLYQPTRSPRVFGMDETHAASHIQNAESNSCSNACSFRNSVSQESNR